MENQGCLMELGAVCHGCGDCEKHEREFLAARENRFAVKYPRIEAGDVINLCESEAKKWNCDYARVIFRYYTLNFNLGRYWKNYASRVVLMEGANAGKIVSVK